MEKFTKLLWDLQQESFEDYEFNDRIINEFLDVEKELIDKLKSEEAVSQDEIKYRNKLNKLASSIPPFLIEVYDIKNKLDKGYIQ